MSTLAVKWKVVIEEYAVGVTCVSPAYNNTGLARAGMVSTLSPCNLRVLSSLHWRSWLSVVAGAVSSI